MHQFHGLQFLQQGFLTYFIFCLSSFFFKVTCISDITYITYFITKMLQVAVYHIKSNIRPGMSQMRLTGNSRTTYIQTDMAWGYGFEFFFLPGV
ncbi:hypothetical protein D3C87_1985230 [compost metagenome]